MQRVGDLLTMHPPTPTAGSYGTTGREEAAEPVCPLCEGARFVRVTMDPANPNFGRPVPCACAQREDAQARTHV